MPFPNAASLELKEKLKFMQTRFKKVDDSSFSRNIYENMCMRAVNQSIGRAIRHKDDYAVILLLDHRYERVRSKLPGWIRDAGVSSCDFDNGLRCVEGFFKSKKQSPK